MKIININKELIEKSPLKDTTYTIVDLINKAKNDNNKTVCISFEKDTYIFKGEYATQNYHYVTNNDHGIQDIIFKINKMENVIIDGNGSTFLFEGRISPFFIDYSKNITIKNLSIDYIRPMYSEGVILKADKNSVQVKIDKELYPYEVKEDGHIEFYGENYFSDWAWGMLEFDCISKAPKDNAVDYFIKDKIYGKQISNDILEITYPFNQVCSVNNILVIKHEQRLVQAITIDRSENINIENVIIYHCGAMAITAQFSKDIKIKNTKVIRNKDKNRVVSANADAVHCVGCRGQIEITDSIFENQMDDALNVHGNYLLIDKIINEKTVLAKIGHFQHFGIFEYHKGSKIEISNRETLLQETILTLNSSQIINNQYIILNFEEEYSFDKEINYCIDNLDNYPSLIFKNNLVQKNRARGILLKTKGDILIENNVINTLGAAFQICCDMNFWFESGGSNNIVIRNNTISGKRTHTWGAGLFDIKQETNNFINKRYIQNKIIIENNDIYLNEHLLIHGNSIKELIIANNTFHQTSKDINIIKKGIQTKLDHIGNLKFEKNILKNS